MGRSSHPSVPLWAKFPQPTMSNNPLLLPALRLTRVPHRGRSRQWSPGAEVGWTTSGLEDSQSRSSPWAERKRAPMKIETNASQSVKRGLRWPRGGQQRAITREGGRRCRPVCWLEQNRRCCISQWSHLAHIWNLKKCNKNCKWKEDKRNIALELGKETGWAQTRTKCKPAP